MENITQDNYDTALQRVRNLSILVNLLSSNMQIVDKLSGQIIGGSITIDSNSDVRRSCSIELVLEDASFDIEEGKIWLDKYIQIYTGIENISTGVVDWVNQGIYLINNPTIYYSGSETKLSFQGLDLMSKLTGIRNGYLESMVTQIPQGSSIRDSMISVLTQYGGFTKYTIEENSITTPYDINVDIGGTVFDILKELRDINPNYEIFFDVNGTFVYQEIPQGYDDPIIVDNDTWDKVCLSSEKNKKFDEIKNVIDVYGRAIEPSYFQTKTTTVSSGAYVIATNAGSIVENDIVGFVTPSILISPKVKIDGGTAVDLVNEDGTYATISESDAFYCIKKLASGKYLFLGGQQIHAIAKDENPDSPYYIGGSMGEIRIPLIGGDYDNIWSDDLALQRAEYELYLRARMNDSITLTCVPLYYLDVNIKIEHQISEDYESNQYIIKSISLDLSPTGTQSIQAIRFYESIA